MSDLDTTPGRPWVTDDDPRWQPDPLINGAPGHLVAYHLDGIHWSDARAPRRMHRCSAQTDSWDLLDQMQFCACGATRTNRDPRWREKNSKRKQGRA